MFFSRLGFAMVAVTAVNPAQVLAKATMVAGELLGLKDPALSRILGISEAAISRIQSGVQGLDPDSKEGELAILLIRVFLSLDSLVGKDDGKRHAWMSSMNRGLGGIPAQLIQSIEGLVATLNYLDGISFSPQSIFEKSSDIFPTA